MFVCVSRASSAAAAVVRMSGAGCIPLSPSLSASEAVGGEAGSTGAAGAMGLVLNSRLAYCNAQGRKAEAKRESR